MLVGVRESGIIGPAQLGDAQFNTLAARRSVLEAALFAAAAGTDGVTVRCGAQVRSLNTSLTHATGVSHVEVVVIRDRDRVTADLVVDASGRRTALGRPAARPWSCWPPRRRW